MLNQYSAILRIRSRCKSGQSSRFLSTMAYIRRQFEFYETFRKIAIRDKYIFDIKHIVSGF